MLKETLPYTNIDGVICYDYGDREKMLQKIGETSIFLSAKVLGNLE
ncbi:hypothetical protein BH10BAC4_BH10BAC4_05390 [soil metagenome]